MSALTNGVGANGEPVTFRWVSSDALRRTWVTGPWDRFVGASHVPPPEHDWTELVHPADLAAYRADIAVATRTARPFALVCRVRRHDGVYRWIVDQGAPRFAAPEVLIGYTGVVIDVTDHRLAAETLADRSERLWLATDAAGIGIHDYHPLDNTIEWDARVRELWGVTSTEVISHDTFLNGIHPADRMGAEVGLRRALDIEGDGRYRAEYRVISRATGDVRWVAATGRAYFEGGQAVRFIGTVHDISERKLAELAHAVVEARLAMVLEQLPAAVAVLDAERRMLARNAAISEYLPLLESRTTAVIGPEEQPIDIGELLDRALCQSPSASSTEFRHQLTDQRTVWRRFEVVPLIAAHMGLHGALVMITDIDEARQAAQTVRESEALFRSIGEAVPDFLWMSDATGKPVYQNPAWRAYVGQALDEQGPRLSDLHPPEDAARVSAEWEAARSAGRRLDSHVQLRRHDGTYRWFAARTVPIHNAAGQVRSWVGTLTDIHESREAQEALRVAAQRKDEFLAMLAHELRNPLAPIQHALVILRHAVDAPDLRGSAIAVIERQTAQLARLVEDLLDVSRISRGTLALRPTVVRADEAIMRGVETAQPLITRRRHELAVQLPDPPVRIRVDVGRVAQLLGNLLSNAAKYTPPAGRIRLTAATNEDRLLIDVEDNGIGVAPERLGRIFDLYEHGPQPASSRADGLGIGLTLVRRLVEAHGGTVEAASDGPGQGCRFRVVLPVVVRDDDATLTTVSESPS